MTSYKVGYFVVSLSSTSINRLLAKALVRLAPPELQRGCRRDAGGDRAGSLHHERRYLLPQETAKVTFSHAILFRWAGDRLRSSCRQR